jgi:hypothetical protein
VLETPFYKDASPPGFSIQLAKLQAEPRANNVPNLFHDTF